MFLATKSAYAKIQIKLLNSNDTANESIPLKTTPIDPIVIMINLILMIFGIIGNILCICVFCRKSMVKRRFNWYLLILACVDLLFCCMIFAGYLVRYPNGERSLYDLSKITCYLNEYILNVLDSLTVFLALIMSVDRFYGVLCPVKSKRFYTNLYPMRVVALVFLFIAVANLPYLIYNQRIYVNFPSVTSQKFDTSAKKNDFDLDLSFLFKKVNKPTIESNFDYDSSEYNYGHEDYSSTQKLVKREVKHVKEKNIQPYCKYDTAFDGLDIKQIKDVFVYIISPLLLNIIPAFIIVFLNILLFVFIKLHRQSTKESKSNKNDGLRYQSGPVLSKENRSYCFVIICLAGWILLSSIPYYVMIAIDWVNNLNIDYYKSRSLMELQAVTATLFNTNHLINMLVYMLFHDTFSLNLKKMIYEVLNLRHRFFSNSSDSPLTSVDSAKGLNKMSKKSNSPKSLNSSELKQLSSKMNSKKAYETRLSLNNEHLKALTDV